LDYVEKLERKNPREKIFLKSGTSIVQGTRRELKISLLKQIPPVVESSYAKPARAVLNVLRTKSPDFFEKLKLQLRRDLIPGKLGIEKTLKI
jgi:hypothetical protein